MRPEDLRIGVIGAGVVGGALLRWFATRGSDARGYDPGQGLHDAGAIARAEVVFVCVPTPYTPGRGFDDRALLDAVRGVGGRKLVVIKSTVLPGTTDLLQARFPQHRFAFNPEFLREASAFEDMVHPDRQVIGCTAQSRTEAPVLLDLLPPAPFVRVCGAREAEMAKYAANSFLAVKVSFANELFDLCHRMDIDYAGVRDIAAADARIGASHLDVFDGGYRGYGGKCLPKDSKALLDLAKSLGLDLRVLRAADGVNAGLTEVAPAADAPARRQPLRLVTPAAAAERAA